MFGISRGWAGEWRFFTSRTRQSSAKSCAAVASALEAHGFVVVAAEGVAAAKAVIMERDDLTGALLDIRLRDGNGIDLCEWMAVERPALAAHTAFLTGSADTEARARLAKLGCRVLSKPFEIAALLELAADWEDATDVEPL